MLTWGYDQTPRPLWRWSHPTTARVLPAAAIAFAIAAILIAVPSLRGESASGAIGVGVPTLAAVLFALPARSALGLVAVLAIGTLLVLGAMYAARTIGAL